MRSIVIGFIIRFLPVLVLCLGPSTQAMADSPNFKTGSAVLNVPLLVGPETFDQAVQSYNSGKYSESLTKLEQLHEAVDFNDLKFKNLHDKTHYYMGLCHQCMNQVAPALKDFQWVYVNSKDNLLRYNSQIAYQQLAYYQGHRRYQGYSNVFARDGQPVRRTSAFSRRSADDSDSFMPPVPT